MILYDLSTKSYFLSKQNLKRRTFRTNNFWPRFFFLKLYNNQYTLINYVKVCSLNFRYFCFPLQYFTNLSNLVNRYSPKSLRMKINDFLVFINTIQRNLFLLRASTLKYVSFKLDKDKMTILELTNKCYKNRSTLNYMLNSRSLWRYIDKYRYKVTE